MAHTLGCSLLLHLMILHSFHQMMAAPPLLFVCHVLCLSGCENTRHETLWNYFKFCLFLQFDVPNLVFFLSFASLTWLFCVFALRKAKPNAYKCTSKLSKQKRFFFSFPKKVDIYFAYLFHHIFQTFFPFSIFSFCFCSLI